MTQSKKKSTGSAGSESQEKSQPGISELASVLTKKGQGSKRVPHLTELLEELFKIWKGPAGVARKIDSEFKAARPGSLQRSKLLDGTVRMIEQTTKLGLGAPEVDAARLSQGDLLRAIQDTMPKPGTDLGEDDAEDDDPEATADF